MSSCGTFNKGSKLEVTPNKALTSLQGFMEGYTQGLENSSDDKKLQQGKLFRQALMLLASPNGIALTTPEDIILQASQDIAESAQGSINLSAQKNIVAHAQDKISLFAAQKGLSAYAAKGKVQIQAQDDAIEAIAKKVIKLISTEDKIEITSPKEIVLTAGGSQLKVNASGVFVTTGGKFESKAGQHIFSGGAAVNAELPKMPESGMYSMRFDLSQIFDTNILKNMKYKLINAPIKEDYAKNLLKGRGVMDYDLFINPTKECLIDPMKLDNMYEGFDLLKTNIDQNKKIVIVIDCDVDGFTSAAILWNRIKEFKSDTDLEYRMHSGKQHGLEDIIGELEEGNSLPSLVILPDASSNDYEYHTRLKNMGVNVLVLDHHEADYESEDAIVVNNQLSENYENKALTGAGVVWQFCRYFDTYVSQEGTSDKYIDLADIS